MSICGHLFRSKWKAVRVCILAYRLHILSLPLKIPRIQQPIALKIAFCFWSLHCRHLSPFQQTAVNIGTNHISPETRLPGLYFCFRQYGSLSSWFTQNKLCKCSRVRHGHWGSFRVIDFNTSRKRAFDFLLVFSSNLVAFCTVSEMRCCKSMRRLTVLLSMQHGWKMASKKTWKLKSPKFRFFYFLVKFYTNHIKFHILIVICVLCYLFQKCSKREWIVYRMFFLGGNFVSSLICTLKSKKPKNFFLKNLGFFQPCYAEEVWLLVQLTMHVLCCCV